MSNEKEPDKKQKKTNSTKKKLSFKTKLLLFILSVAGIFFLKQGFVLLLVGMVPAAVAMLVDTTSTRAWTKTVASFNLAGLMPTLVEMAISQGNNLALLQEKMGDPMLWFLAYGSAGIGWIVIWICPRIMEKILRVYYRYCAERHQGKLAKIDAEWGISDSKALES